jgi:hypothetical protein
MFVHRLLDNVAPRCVLIVLLHPTITIQWLGAVANTAATWEWSRLALVRLLGRLLGIRLLLAQCSNLLL